MLPDQESGDESAAFGDYMDKDGQQVPVDSDLLHPTVKSALNKQNKDVLPCEMDSILLCGAEQKNDDIVDSNNSGEIEFVLDEGDQTDVSASSGSESSQSDSVPRHRGREGGGGGRSRRRGSRRLRQERDQGKRRGRGRGRQQSHSVDHLKIKVENREIQHGGGLLVYKFLVINVCRQIQPKR